MGTTIAVIVKRGGNVTAHSVVLKIDLQIEIAYVKSVKLLVLISQTRVNLDYMRMVADCPTCKWTKRLIVVEKLYRICKGKS